MKNVEELLEKILSEGKLATLTHRSGAFYISRSGLKLGNLFVALDINIQKLCFYEIKSANIETVLSIGKFLINDVIPQEISERIRYLCEKEEEEKRKREIDQVTPKLLKLANAT